MPGNGVRKMKPPFSSPGGKARLAPILTRLYPEHQVYIEPFSGAASCLFAKEPRGDEWLNDWDEGIVAVHTWLRDTSPADLKQWATHPDWVFTEAMYEKSGRKAQNRGEVARRWLIRRKGSFMHRDGYMAKTKVGKNISPGKIVLDWHKRLRNVRVTQGDGLKVIQENDRPGVLFFLDPPYPGVVNQWSHYTMKDIQALIDALDKLKHADWLYAETPNVMEMVPATWEYVMLEHVAPSYNGKRRKHQEVVYGSASVLDRADRYGLSKGGTDFVSQD